MAKTFEPSVSDICLCGNTKLTGLRQCERCWSLTQIVQTHAVKLLGNPSTEAATRRLLEKALETKVEPPAEGT